MLSGKTNDVTLFSNGIGHFRRTYEVAAGKETRISIPFKTDSIGDVAASLQVFGKVRLNSPPSFTPANSNATSLNICQSEAMKSLLRQLSGSQVTIDVRNSSIPNEEYTLLGLDTEASFNHTGGELQKDFLVAMKDGAVRRFPLSDINDVHFKDESVRTEIDKALKANFQKIKPDSTLLDICVSSIGKDSTEANVQYTIPVAAWKMRYAIREEDSKFSIEGAAIIDNNTDEDWINFKVSVVTGNPISFNTDIADVIVPQRRMVHLVDRLSLGNVDVEEGVMMAACASGGAPMGMDSSAHIMSLRSKMSVSNRAGFGLESCSADDLDYDNAPMAEAPGVESEDIGDFCVFSCKEPITILARKSAVVPMFSVPLKHAGVVLLYKESNHARRPFRAIKFKNETEYSLGRGKTVIYNQGLFSGECVLDSTKPGENRMLPHCLENGVKIIKSKSESTSRRSSINISDGVAVVEHVQSGLTEYTIENKKDETFKVALEHVNRVPGDNTMVNISGVDIKEREKLDHGWRVYFEVSPNQKTTLTVTESHLNRQTTIIKQRSGFNWITHNIIDVENPIADDPQIKACVEIQKNIDKTERDRNDARARLTELNEQIDRVRQNLEAAQNVASGGKLDKWIDDLDTSEEEIRKISKEVMPQLSKELQVLNEKMSEALQKVTASWKEE